MESYLAAGICSYSASSPAIGMAVDPAVSLSNKYSLNPRNVVSSAYWKVPDPKINLTAIACHESEPFVAVASAARDSNLFIYEVEPPKPNARSLEPENYFSNAAATDTEDERKAKARCDNAEEEEVSYYHSTASHRSPAIYAKKRMNATRTPRKYHKRSVSENATAATAGVFDFTSWPDDKGAAPTASSSRSAGAVATSADQQASPILTHHQTISLGGIYSLAWVPAQLTRGAFGNVLATGHGAGLLHLVLLPDPYTNNGPAEIVTRFNHTRHVPVERQTSSRVRTINIAPETWSCTPDAAVISMFSEHLFVWDPERCTAPILMQRTKRARALHAAPKRNGIVALATDRGISIMDMRFKQPVALAPPHDNGGFVSHVRWATLDENKVASVHDSTLIKIWDIRTGSPLVCLEGHYDKINAIEWSSAVEQPEELFSASSDGTVRLWDIEKCTDMSDDDIVTEYESQTSPAPATAAETKKGHRRTRSEQDAGLDWLPSKSWRLYRQRLARENSLPSYNYFLDNQNPYSPCTTIFSNNKEFLGLAMVNMPTGAGMGEPTRPHLVSIDNDGFFGVHTKVVGKAPVDQVFYSEPTVSTSAATAMAASATGSAAVDALAQELAALCQIPAGTAAAPAITTTTSAGVEAGKKGSSFGSLASLTEGDEDYDDEAADLDRRLDTRSDAWSTPSSPSFKPSSSRNSSELYRAGILATAPAAATACTHDNGDLNDIPPLLAAHPAFQLP
jgi:WD40 repeat protein